MSANKGGQRPHLQHGDPHPRHRGASTPGACPGPDDRVTDAGSHQRLAHTGSHDGVTDADATSPTPAPRTASPTPAPTAASPAPTAESPTPTPTPTPAPPDHRAGRGRRRRAVRRTCRRWVRRVRHLDGTTSGGTTTGAGGSGGATTSGGLTARRPHAADHPRAVGGVEAGGGSTASTAPSYALLGLGGLLVLAAFGNTVSLRSLRTGPPRGRGPLVVPACAGSGVAARQPVPGSPSRARSCLGVAHGRAPTQVPPVPGRSRPRPAIEARRTPRPHRRAGTHRHWSCRLRTAAGCSSRRSASTRRC
jgi:hypothetical protein